MCGLFSGSTSLTADFRRRFDPRRIRPAFLGVAVAIPIGLMYLGILVSLLFGDSADQLRVSRDANLVVMILLVADRTTFAAGPRTFLDDPRADAATT